MCEWARSLRPVAHSHILCFLFEILQLMAMNTNPNIVYSLIILIFKCALWIIQSFSIMFRLMSWRYDMK